MEMLNEFWNVVLDVWKKGLLGIDLGRIIAAVFIFIGFLLLRRFFTKIIMGRLNALTRRTKTTLDDDALEVIKRPLEFLPIILGLFFATEFLSLEGSVAEMADKLIRSLIVFVIFWSLVRLVKPFSVFAKRLETVLTSSMVDWLIKAVNVAFIFIAAATILEIWGIKIGPIIAGLGLFGVAVALGAQDLCKNLISGILILAEQRFNIGDWIRVDGMVEGTVESIGFRSTLVRRFDKAPVFVPNASLSDQSVINFSEMTHRRINWIIGVEYGTTIEQLRQIRNGIEAYILTNDSFANPPTVPTFVRIDKFNDSSIDIMVYCFTNTTVWGDWLEIKELLAYEIKKIVEKAGTGFAFPSQSIYVESMPTEHAEVFIPPEKNE